MTHLTRSIRSFEKRFDMGAQRFAHRHPVLGFLAMFVGVPVTVLLAVGIGTAAVVFPISLVMGWL